MINLQDRVYVRDHDRGSTRELFQGVVVAKKVVWYKCLPHRRYVVKKVNNTTDGIIGILSAAFNGSADDLKYCTSNDLILVPIVDVAPEGSNG